MTDYDTMRVEAEAVSGELQGRYASRGVSGVTHQISIYGGSTGYGGFDADGKLLEKGGRE